MLVMVLQTEGVNDVIQTEEGGSIETEERVVDEGVNDVIVDQVEDGGIAEQVEVVHVRNEDVFLPLVGLELHKVIDEVEQWLDEILREGRFQKKSQTYDATQSDNGGNDEDVTKVEFNNGKDNDVLVDKVKLDVEHIVMLLEARYNMEEIEVMGGVQVELDDMVPVELDMVDVPDHPIDNDDDAIIDDVVDDAVIDDIGDDVFQDGDSNGE
ncbi:unnamed protein product [Lactuca virosa]|uniref:Uncharacterized protein n=1 Tax=Lactuca virosa TaxID=75947 RepID=A0AAU9LX07_9ASTR|nr:unnamed protein product [Lactuca virosa]